MSNDKHHLDSILVIIPVRDEEIAITGVISALKSLGLHKILVVDNGSTDCSITKAQAAGAKVIIEPIPGYGRACWRGLQELTPEIEWILFCDGDGSDDLGSVPNLIAKMPEFDFILGDRRATFQGRKAMTAIQNFGNGLATYLMGLGWGYWYHDLSPLRLIHRSALEQIQMQDRGFGWTVEMQARAIECGLRICELPVGYRQRQGGRSKISGTLRGSIQAGTIILTTLGKLYLRRLSQYTNSPFWLWLSAICLILGAIVAMPYGNFAQPEAVPHFWWGMGVMALGFVLSWRIASIKGVWFWAIVIITRLILLPMYPGDDIWRYLWEGYIQLQGFSPYDFAPNAPELLSYRTQWWANINHLDVSAIYPPITQIGFRILAAISSTVILFKIAFVAADLLVCWLLSRRFGYQKTLLYAWNPLIIYSFAGSAHYDSWFILPLVAAWLVFEGSKKERRWLQSALLVGISVAIKWMSLPILGFLVWRGFLRLGLIKALIILGYGFLPLILSSFSFCSSGSCQLIPTSSVFVSHGRSAEFIPYLVSYIWEPSRWENWLFLFPLALASFWLLLRAKSFSIFTEWYLIFVLLLSPIIHAWYFTWLVPFAVASRNWGTRLLSISAFIYFALPYRQALGNEDWFLTNPERLWLWLPFVVGLFWIKDE